MSAAPAVRGAVQPDGRCDFCGTVLPGPTCGTYRGVDYVVHAFEIEGIGPIAGSEGGWAACDPCAVLIDADAWEGLARRCTAAMRAVVPSLNELQVYGLVREIHEEFRRARL